MERITVFTPTYNRRQSLTRVFESLQKQTYRDFNWIIVDDGSKDDTKSLIDEFIVKADFKIIYIYQENAGKHSAINRGLKETTSELFLIADSDDSFKENALEIFINTWESIPLEERSQWAIANRNGYASCHGGQKEFRLDNGEKFVASFFGLSGSGKSTLTHATHNNKYEEIQVLHDDAFIINTETGASIAMEPTYFDKTADYPTGCPDNKYLLTAQNCSATRDSEGKVVLVTEDIRNGNGRAIKSKLWSPNRVDKINDPVNAIFWIMKDPTIPPIVKIKGASLASVMGATLATKRSSAERLAPGVDPNRLVVEPYANPFRTYPLVNDYKKFRKLVKERNVDCYIINTGDFMGKDIKPATTISAIEQVVEGTGEFKQWGPFTDIEVLEMEGYVSDFNDMNYVETLKARMTDRLNFVFEKDVEDGGYNALPTQAKEALAKVIGEAHNLEVENSNN